MIYNWANLNCIRINESKSHIMILKNNIDENDNIEGYPIIAEYKYLGIYINDKMNIQKYIYNVS